MAKFLQLITQGRECCPVMRLVNTQGKAVKYRLIVDCFFLDRQSLTDSMLA
ncbi:hypothetical protein [Nitrosomonas sp. Nm58]|uniref:hypothetical protein n=1 Tax=Nitrosomonas sp. Nm58 TaxID=200126 RepID=UPI0015A6B5A4|nr:hypothetical protein [Nitrosomonas sp. Nm58]